MTFEQFDRYMDGLIKDVLEMRDTKGKEYCHNIDDRFDNFNRLASKINLDRLRVWQVFFCKHVDAIDSYIAHGRVFSDEQIRGRIVDAITYLMLLAGMIEESETGAQRSANDPR